jgi:Holliday junction resolvase
MRKRGKVDKNQSEIVSVFRQMGASVVSTANIGGGFPDLVIGRNNVNYLIEIKDGSRKPSEQRLTTEEITFHETWKGQVTVISSIQEAINFLNERTK